MLQNQGALQVFVRVTAAGEPKVAFQVSSGFTKYVNDGGRHRITIDCGRAPPLVISNWSYAAGLKDASPVLAGRLIFKVHGTRMKTF